MSITRTEIENKIKIQSDEDWLTPSQANIIKELNPFIDGIERVLNIYGHQGVGKSFLAHILMKSKSVSYITSIDLICNSELPLIIDNFPYERTKVRGIRNLMRKFELRQVILISRYRAEDTIPTFGLTLTAEDLRFFRANLFRNFDYCLPESISLNLWEHMKLIGDRNV